MKVLQLLCGTAWDGGSVAGLAITRAMITRGDQVWVVNFETKNDQKIREAGATLVRIPSWTRAIRPLDFWVLFSLWRLCRREKFDLVATRTAKGGFLGRLAARLAGIPHVVHHAYGFSFNRELRPLTRRSYILLEWLAARAGHFIISVNEEQRQRAIRLGVESPDRICTVPDGVDLGGYANQDRRTARAELGFDDSVLLIGAIGRLVPQKGLDCLIRALPVVLRAVPAAYLVIVGEGPLKSELETEALRYGVAERVRLVGIRRDIPQVLASFDVYVQPALWESHSVSLIGALAAGKPIVATDIEDNRDVIEHGKTGLLVPAGDWAALASALRATLLDPNLALILGEAAQRAAADRFCQQRMIEQTLTAYDRVVTPRDWRTSHCRIPLRGARLKAPVQGRG
ncbi:MAG: hypothetical protein DMG06_12800 [Acidobacteria bacterium]|nr:MAG: hypothetical protein DMG06_12800 [Acidobacteriota bacterium]